MFCGKCGGKHLDSDVFCRKCGVKIDVQKPEQAPMQNPIQLSTKKPVLKSSLPSSAHPLESKNVTLKQQAERWHAEYLCMYCGGKRSKWNGACKACGKGSQLKNAIIAVAKFLHLL